jgi:hypothetical protein
MAGPLLGLNSPRGSAGGGSGIARAPEARLAGADLALCVAFSARRVWGRVLFLPAALALLDLDMFASAPDS